MQQQQTGTSTLNHSVQMIQTTMDNLMAKNDSVSYDMHVAAFDTMLAQLTETNQFVLDNANATTALATNIRGDYAALTTSIQSDYANVQSNHAALQQQLGLLNATTSETFDATKAGIATAMEQMADEQNEQQDNIISRQDALIKMVESNANATNINIKSNAHDFYSLNGTVFTFMDEYANYT
jgi:hypothetical protein